MCIINIITEEEEERINIYSDAGGESNGKLDLGVSRYRTEGDDE